MTSRCTYDPDKIFRRFKLTEFTPSFVGLANSLDLDLEVDLTGPCYLRTMFRDTLLTFDEARGVSPDHRAFTIVPLDNQIVRVIFKPTNECISKAIKMQKHLDKIDNRFVVDLRAIQADGLRCSCNNIHHAEIGRYYFFGTYAYCNIVHFPNVIDFGVVILKRHAVRTIRIRNESKLSAKMTYIKTAGFEVSPRSFIIQSKSSKKVEISLNPNNNNLSNTIVFNVRNSYDPYTEPLNSGVPMTDFNFLEYKITVTVKVKFETLAKTPVVKSLQSIWEPKPHLAYLNEELIKHNAQKLKLGQYLAFAKSNKKKVPEKQNNNMECYSEPPQARDPKRNGNFFCKYMRSRITASDLLDVIVSPYCLDFGKVAINTYGESSVLVKNRTKYDIDIKFLDNNILVYTQEKLSTYGLKLKSLAECTIDVLCYGNIKHRNDETYTFTYVIDKKFYVQNLFQLEVGSAVLSVKDNVLKFGMITSEQFVTSVPVKIYNSYNVPINFEWPELPQDAPFQISPTKGTISEHGLKICDARYIPRIYKFKMYDIHLISKSALLKHFIPIEAHIITRKLAVKFVFSQVQFKDIPLNLKVSEEARFENNSREIAVFRVMEPSVPGITVTPMEGIINPKAVVILTISVQIACILEFSFDLCVKVNNKENVGILVFGRVVEPKIVVHPRNLIMPRLPCGLITYVPVKFHNTGTAKSKIEVLQMDDENIFKVYVQSGMEKEIISEFTLEPGQSMTLFVRVYDVFRREYDHYIPFRVNDILGPPAEDSNSTEINHFIQEYKQIYENNPKVILKCPCKDIPYFRISGVFTLPWIKFSTENFETRYTICEINKIIFSITNVSKYTFNVTLNTSKLLPHFSMEVATESSMEALLSSDNPNNTTYCTDNVIKFELDTKQSAVATVYFHPQRQGKFVGVAPMYLDTAMTIAYSNLTFIGTREFAAMNASVVRIVFPPCRVGIEVSDTFTIFLEEESDVEMFRCSSKEESHIRVEFIDIERLEVKEEIHTRVTVRVTAHSSEPYTRNMYLNFNHDCGSSCNVLLFFCFTQCAITLHTDAFVLPKDNPYPYYPLETQTALYEYLQRCLEVMEKWMYYIGFRRELYAIIPETFHAIAISMSVSQLHGSRKPKYKSMTIINFFRRIAGPLIKNVPKFAYPTTIDESLRCIKEIHDLYEFMIKLILARGAQVPLLKAKYLLTYEQFVTLTTYERPKCIADDDVFRYLRDNEDMFNRLTKQCWFDFLLQSYKVFILDSCLFQCVCVSNENRDIIQIMINWYNEQINFTRICLNGKNDNRKLNKTVTNLTTDLMDGIAIICTIYNHCSFLRDHVSLFQEVHNNDPSGIVHNACIIMEALNILKVYFPLNSTDLIDPNFIHMLMFSVHLYILLPMFRQKSVVYFNPPLLRTSVRTLTITPTTQEQLIFGFIILNNTHNSFSVERIIGENGKKLYLVLKYFAKFITEDQAVLLVHGYNKTRAFDTFMTFDLLGRVGALYPMRKCKILAPLYRPMKVDVVVHSPFEETVPYDLLLTEIEPTIPITFEEAPVKGFYVKRLKLVDNVVTLTGLPTEFNADVVEHKVFLQTYCLSCQTLQYYLWFRSVAGEFFIKITSQPRWDVPVDTQQVSVYSWPIDPCSCGEDCECYRTSVVNIPHRNPLMLSALRCALVDFATPLMIEYFDKLIVTELGQVIAMLLLLEAGTNPSEVSHILRPETTYHIFSRSVLPRLDRATLRINSDDVLSLPITIPPNETSVKFTITLSSQCNMDIRNYRFLITLVELEKTLTKIQLDAPSSTKGQSQTE